MSSQDVIYKLSLKDELTKGIEKADASAKKLDGTMNLLKTGMKALGAIGGAIAIKNFFSDSIQAFNESEQATGQLRAGLISTAGAAGVTETALLEQASALQKITTFGDDAIVGMDSLLLTFTNIKGSILTDAVPAVLDLATRMGGDLQGAALQVGKALNDPIQGINALKRSGVSFSDTQIKQIKNFTETNQLAKAQQMIIAELNNEFGGSSEMAAKVGMGPWQVLGNMYNDVQEDIGKLTLSMGSMLLPVINSTVTGLSNMVNWISENKKLIKELAIVIGVATTAYGLYYVATNAISMATKIWTAVQWGINAALTANPIGLVIAGIAALTAAVVVAYEKSAVFRAGLWGLWGAIKAVGESIKMYFVGLKDVLVGTFTLDPKQIESGLSGMASAVFGAGSRIAKGAQEGYQAGMADFAKDQQAKKEAEAQGGGTPAPTTGLATAGAGGANPTPSKSKSVAQGTKITTINVSIKDLIGNYNMNVTNVREGSDKIKQMVVDALMGAVNDFQLIVQ